MPYSFKTSSSLDRVLKKLFKRDRITYEKVMKKINEIINSSDIEHYKNLRYDLNEYKRVHMGHFVPVFKFNKSGNLIEFSDFDHHDNIYKKKL